MAKAKPKAKPKAKTKVQLKKQSKDQPKAQPKDQQPKAQSKAQSKGQKTVEPFIAVCQCGEVRYTVGKRTKTAVGIECQACGTKSSVKGNVAPVRVGEAEVAFAVKEKVVRPDPDAGKPKDDKPTLGDQGYRTLRFKINEDQDKVVRRALDAVRVMNFEGEAYKSQQWQGTALEQICADFLSGVDPNVLQVIDAMDEKVVEATKKYKIKKPDKDLTKRKVRDVRAAAREATMKELGLWKEEGYEPPEQTPDEEESQKAYQLALQAKKQDEADENRILDDGRLYDGVGEALAEQSDQLAVDGERPKFLIAKQEQYGQLLMKMQKEGVLLRLDGDERTMDKAGRRPSMYIWAQDPDDLPDLPVAYDDAMSGVLEDVQLTTVQIVVQGDEKTVEFADGLEEIAQ
jgi:hypothetical protein